MVAAPERPDPAALWAEWQSAPTRSSVLLSNLAALHQDHFSIGLHTFP